MSTLERASTRGRYRLLLSLPAALLFPVVAARSRRRRRPPAVARGLPGPGRGAVQDPGRSQELVGHGRFRPGPRWTGNGPPRRSRSSRKTVIVHRRRPRRGRSSKAVETKDGQTRDITAAVAEERRERTWTGSASAGRGAGQGRRRRLAGPAAWPSTRSSPSRPRSVPSMSSSPSRARRSTGRRPSSSTSRPRSRTTKHWQGRSGSIRRRADLRRAEIKPAETPPFVKEIDIAITFDTHPSGPIVLRSFRITDQRRVLPQARPPGRRRGIFGLPEDSGPAPEGRRP